MTNGGVEGQENQQPEVYAPELRRGSALDVAYGDLHAHYLAIIRFAEGGQLNSMEEDYFHAGSTNSLHYLPPASGDEATEFECLLIESHRTLLQEARAEYGRIDRRNLRAVLSGTFPEMVGELSGAKIQDQEMAKLIDAGVKNGVIKLNESVSPNDVFIEPTKRGTFFSLTVALLTAGKGDSTEEGHRKEKDMKSSSTNMQDVYKAAVHKLACYLGIIDQLSFEEASEGHPVDATARPVVDNDFRRGLVEEYGEFPGIAGLYEMALETLRQYSEPDDELVRPILEQGPLPEDRFAA